jgi:uncharacterized protein YkuJ
MKETNDERTQVKFSAPDPSTNIIKVSRVLPDGSEESIGQVYPDFGNGDESIIYRSVDRNGEETLPPTSDFIEIEKQFEKNIQQVAEISYFRDMESMAEEYEMREEEIKSLRQYKHRTKLKLLLR